MSEILITTINERGEGIGRIGGKVHFVESAVPGDRLLIKIIQQKKAYNKARIVKIVNPSPFRITAPCSFAKHCGGCSVQQISYDEQLKLKTALVTDAIERIALQKGYELQSIIGMSDPYRYRNKALLPAALINGQLRLGLYQKGSHQLVDIDDCLIQDPICGAIIQLVEQWANNYGIMPYDEKQGTGQLRHVMLRTTRYGEHMIGLVTKTASVKQLDALIKLITAQHPSVVSIVQNINDKAGNRILGDRFKMLYGSSSVIDCIGDIDYELSMASFFQVNPRQTIKLYNKAIELADLQGDEVAWDIYCGAGSITLQLAKHVKWVYGNEIVPQAIVDARANAARNAIDNVTFIEGAAEAIVPTWLDKYDRPDVVFLDPPRKGAAQAVLAAIVKISPQKIVYISCKPSTLARDIKYLVANDYQLKTVVPVDMFAHSMHVECIVLLQR